MPDALPEAKLKPPATRNLRAARPSLLVCGGSIIEPGGRRDDPLAAGIFGF
jgi:hypothetical protein